MSAPSPRMEADGQPAAEALLDVFKAIEPTELSKHEAVLAYWLSIRGNRELPPLRDLDPLEISDAASNSVLLELIGGGEDAEIRHVGEKLKGSEEFEKISLAPRPSVLASIARKLSIVAISRNFLAFEDEFSSGGMTTRSCVTLLPLSAAGAWVDYVYAFVTIETQAGEKPAKAHVEPAPAEPVVAIDDAEPAAEEDVLELAQPAEEAPEAEIVEVTAEDSEPVEQEPVQAQVAEAPEPAPEPAQEQLPPEPAPVAKKKSGFSFEALAAATGFYGSKPVKVEPVMPTAKVPPRPVPPAPAVQAQDAEQPPVEDIAEPAPPVAEVEDVAEAPAVEEPVSEVEDVEAIPVEDIAVADEPDPVVAPEAPVKPSLASEGTLQSKLTEVRSKADEARMAKLRANLALYEGLSAAYDFALDAENSPEEYLRIVEGAGLKIQLRSPMRPVVKLAFEGMCDDSTIAQLEAVLAWAIDQELPRGSLAKQIEQAGGIGPILHGAAKAA